MPAHTPTRTAMCLLLLCTVLLLTACDQASTAAVPPPLDEGKTDSSGGKGEKGEASDTGAQTQSEVDENASQQVPTLDVRSFSSNGDFISGWYWLRDSNLQHYAEWVVEGFEAGAGDAVLRVTALATDTMSGGRGFSGDVTVTYGLLENGTLGEVLGTSRLALPNVAPPDDPVGYLCEGVLVIPASVAAQASTLVIRFERPSPEANHVAFNQESLLPGTASDAGQGGEVLTGVAVSFTSNGDLISGWYWLRDSDLQHYAEWTFTNIPAGIGDIVLDISALATDQASGGGGFPADIVVIYGSPGSGSMGAATQMQQVTLPNVSPPDDPLGYACRGTVTIPASALYDGGTALYVRIERPSAGANHVALNAESIVLMSSR